MKIKPTALSLVGATLLAVFSMAAHAAEPKGHGAHHSAHWIYSGETGASHWGSMEPGFALCKNGKEQSPIDINTAGTGKPSAIDFAYEQGGAQVINNGHTIQVNLAAGGSIKLDGTNYKLLQFRRQGLSAGGSFGAQGRRRSIGGGGGSF